MHSNFPSALPSTADRKHGSSQAGLRTFIAAVRKQLWLSLSITLAVLIGTVAFGLSQRKIYQATATIQIDPKPPTPLGQGIENVAEVGAASYWASQEYYNTQHRIVASKPIALTTVRALGLDRDRKFIANTTDEPPAKIVTLTPERAADIVRRRLTVSPVKESRLVELSYEDADKARAVRILDRLVQAYIENNLNQSVQSTSAAATWLDEQLDTLRKELGSSEIALHKYKLDKQIPTIGLQDQANVLLSEMQSLTMARTQARTKIQTAAARLSQLQKINAENPNSIPQTELLVSAELEHLRSDYTNALREVTALRGAGKGEQHPEMLAAAARLAITVEAIRTEVHNIVTGVEQEVAALKQEEGGLSGLLKTAEDKALELNLMEIEYTRLKRTKDNNEKLYSLVLERSKEANLTQMLRVNNLKVLARAEAVDGPVKPRMALIAAVGLLAGLALGVGAGFLREHSDSSVRSAHDLEARLGLTSLGVIPEVGHTTRANRGKQRRTKVRPEDALELVPMQDPAGALAEAVRNIRTNLLFMSPDKPFKRLLVTSAEPAEGKTTIACYLGITMAQTGQRVLLVDCDLRKPRLNSVFSETVGNATVSGSLLKGVADGLDLLTTEIPNLSVMHAGPLPPNPAELLHSQVFRKLLDQLSSKYDLVILDSPPLVVTDAAIISTLVDGTVLVVRALRTELGSTQRAVRAITDVGGRIIGSVLNGLSDKRGGYGYRYGGRYGYGAYGTYGSKSSSDETRTRS